MGAGIPSFGLLSILLVFGLSPPEINYFRQGLNVGDFDAYQKCIHYTCFKITQKVSFFYERSELLSLHLLSNLKDSLRRLHSQVKNSQGYEKL